MPKAGSYFAVKRGRAPLGIYQSWADCQAQMNSFPGAFYKKFTTEADANAFMTAHDRDTASTTRRPPITPDHRCTANDQLDCDVVYCDGACKGNGQPGSIAGIGVWWGHSDPRNISERCPGDQTNNRAELIAIVRILETTPHLNRPLLIKTDSNYAIQCLTAWIFKWMRNDFVAADGKPVKNRALIKYLVALLHARRKTSQIVKFQHVRGHAGIEGNEAADQLASLGATRPTVPEPDWDKLEKRVLHALKHVKPIKVVDDDLQAYADGLLGNDDLAELLDSSVPESRPSHSATGKTISPTQVSPPRAKAPSTVPVGITVHSKSRLPSGGSSGPTTAFRSSRSSKTLASTALCKEEMETLVSCLLDDDELATLGKDGVFDSDY